MGVFDERIRKRTGIKIKIKISEDIDWITFNFFNVIVITEASQKKGFPLSRCVREEAVGVQGAVTFNCFDCKSLGPRFQTSSKLKFIY